MPWQIVILLSLDQVPTFYHLHFQCHETSLSVPLTWTFVPASYPMGYPFHYSRFPHLCQASSLSLSSCGCTSQVSGERRCQHPKGLWSFSCIQRKFQRYHCLHFHLVASPLFWLFCSVSRGFVYYWETRRQHNCVFCWLSVAWKTDAWWPATSRLGKKWRDDVRLLFMWWSLYFILYSANIPWRLIFEKCWEKRTLFN